MTSIPALWLARLYRFENKHSEAEKVLRGVLQHDRGRMVQRSSN